MGNHQGGNCQSVNQISKGKYLKRLVDQTIKPDEGETNFEV